MREPLPAANLEALAGEDTGSQDYHRHLCTGEPEPPPADPVAVRRRARSAPPPRDGPGDGPRIVFAVRRLRLMLWVIAVWLAVGYFVMLAGKLDLT